MLCEGSGPLLGGRCLGARIRDRLPGFREQVRQGVPNRATGLRGEGVSPPRRRPCGRRRAYAYSVRPHASAVNCRRRAPQMHHRFRVEPLRSCEPAARPRALVTSLGRSGTPHASGLPSSSSTTSSPRSFRCRRNRNNIARAHAHGPPGPDDPPTSDHSLALRRRKKVHLVLDRQHRCAGRH